MINMIAIKICRSTSFATNSVSFKKIQFGFETIRWIRTGSLLD